MTFPRPGRHLASCCPGHSETTKETMLYFSNEAPQVLSSSGHYCPSGKQGGHLLAKSFFFSQLWEERPSQACFGAWGRAHSSVYFTSAPSGGRHQFLSLAIAKLSCNLMQWAHVPGNKIPRNTSGERATATAQGKRVESLVLERCSQPAGVRALLSGPSGSHLDTFWTHA